MLRTLICASMLSLAAFAAPAFAEDAPIALASPMNLPVVSDDGVTLGHVTNVGRNPEGRMVSVHAEGLAPPSDAPANPDANRGLARLPPYHAQSNNIAMNAPRRGASPERLAMR